MTKYVFLLIFMALIFGICALVDWGIKKLFPKTPLETSKHVVRQPRRGAIWGIILTIFPIVVLLFWMPAGGDTVLLIGCISALLFGAVLLVNYASFAIYYDDETFLYKDLRHKKTVYHYTQITGQQSLVTRAGVSTMLFVAGETIELSEAMQGVRDFLSKAFYRWCEEKGIDPDSVENNPEYLTYFPEEADTKTDA